MSDEPDNVLDLGQELQFLPAWAQEDAKSNKYASFDGEPERRGRGGRGGPRGKDNRQRDNQRRNDRPRSPQHRGGRDKPDRPKGKGPRRDNRDRVRPRQEPRKEESLIELKSIIVPSPKGVESIAREIKLTGRAYPLFQIAHLILDRPERYSFDLKVKRKPGGDPVQRLFICKIDQTPWLREEDAVRHALKAHFDKFFETRRTEAEPPKGNYTSVAQCGISGALLGPPNHHAYQGQVARIHAERYSRMAFDEYKSRIRICHDEETVQKWVEQASWKTEFLSRNEEEPLTFAARADAESHFRENKVSEVCEEVDGISLAGPVARELRHPQAMANLLRATWQRQRRYPLDTATQLSKQFGALGLQFFKRDKTVTHVSVARPNYLDLETSAVSESIRRLVEFIDATPECTRRKILEALAPTPAPTEGDAEQTPEQAQLLADLHWLIHQGHVIEFSNNIVETAKRPRTKEEKERAQEESVEVEDNPNDEGSEEAGSAPSGDDGVEVAVDEAEAKSAEEDSDSKKEEAES